MDANHSAGLTPWCGSITAAPNRTTGSGRRYSPGGVDADVVRQHGGVPLEQGSALYLLPLDAQAQSAGYARVRDIRRNETADYDVTRVDSDPVRWTLTILLSARRLAIGQR